MKIKDAINMANLMEQGNVLPKELAILFLSELDGMIQSDIMLHAPEEIVSYTDEEQELLLRPPHDKLYIHYLVMMIRNQQQEYEGYQNSQAAVDEKLKTFRRWYVQHYRPADTDSRSYVGGTSADAFGFAYLTAYGLAVRNGYTGTEEQWLESLHGATGDPGEPARMRYDEAREMIQWGVRDTWYDLFSLQALRDPLMDAFLREAEELAEAAGNSEAAARGHAKTAADAAADALERAGWADTSARNAMQESIQARAAATAATEARNKAATERAGAENAAADALGYAEDAEAQAVTAGNHAQAAEESAKRAEAVAENVGDINDAIEGHNTDLAAHAPMQNNLNALRDKAISEAIGSHSTDSAAHSDIRVSMESLRNKVNILLNSDDVTLDQTKEIVEYIKSNRSLIDAITTSKVSAADIVDNLFTNVANRPLSAAQGVELKRLCDSIAASLSGYQPKGNYLTTDDIGTVADAVKNEIPLVTVAKAPVFVSSKAEMVDTGEVYVLVPDGVLWKYMAVDSVELGAELFEIGGIMGDDGTDAGVDKTKNRIRTAKIPCSTEAPISIVCNSNAKWIVHFFRDGAWLGKTGFVSTNNGDIVQLYSRPDDVTHVRLLLAYTSDANLTDIPDLLSNVTITQQTSGMAWCNTGMAYNQPVDYEDRILAMEAELEALVNGTF